MSFRARHLLGIDHLSPPEIVTEEGRSSATAIVVPVPSMGKVQRVSKIGDSVGRSHAERHARQRKRLPLRSLIGSWARIYHLIG